MPGESQEVTPRRPRSEGILTRAVGIVWRAARLRCPNCGGGGLFRSWFRIVSEFPKCGLALERHEEGYIVGAYMFNMIAAELVFVALLVGVLVFTWPAPPWGWITFCGAALMLLLPVAFYPFSKTLFLGFDPLFRPADDKGT